jgi:hypothetical protein
MDKTKSTTVLYNTLYGIETNVEYINVVSIPSVIDIIQKKIYTIENL